MRTTAAAMGKPRASTTRPSSAREHLRAPGRNTLDAKLPERIGLEPGHDRIALLYRQRDGRDLRHVAERDAEVIDARLYHRDRGSRASGARYHDRAHLHARAG